MNRPALYYRRLRDKSSVGAILFIVLSQVSFFVSDYTSCNAGHFYGDVDCSLRPQPFSEMWRVVAWVSIIAAITSLAIALTASFASRQRKAQSYAGIIKILIMLVPLLILAIPLVYHLSFQVPFNPWDHSKNVLYYLLLYGSVLVLPGLAFAAIVAAITLWFISSPKNSDPGQG